MPQLDRILAQHRQGQFGRCYASSNRSVLCSAVPHLTQMQTDAEGVAVVGMASGLQIGHRHLPVRAARPA